MKHGILFGFAVIMAAIMVLTGCSAGNDYDGTNYLYILSSSTTSEQLAASLAAASPGDTVTLPSSVTLTGHITVPMGVTLDLTTPNAALTLGNNAVLTVDGTVKTHSSYSFVGSNTVAETANGRILVESVTASGATINGNGTIDLTGTQAAHQGLLLGIDTGKKLTVTGGVTLKGLKNGVDGDTVNNTAPLIGVMGALEMSGSARVMGNADSSTSEGINGGVTGGGVIVAMGTFTMSDSASVSDNTSGGGGGGVIVAMGAVFTMSGNASVWGNTAAHHGGGVNVNTQSAFTMLDNALVSDNIADGRTGGGVYVCEQAVFTMSGGYISNNRSNWGGGGVSIHDTDTVFSMTGGTIAGNTATGASMWGYGGGVFVWVDPGDYANPKFYKSGGWIMADNNAMTGKVLYKSANGTAKFGTPGSSYSDDIVASDGNDGYTDTEL
jgi:hypothetical protein